MRGLYVLALMVLLLPTTQYGLSSYPDDHVMLAASETSVVSSSATIAAVAGYEILISQVSPNSVEFIVLTNYGTRAQDLNGSTISDGEGMLTFDQTCELQSGCSLAIAKDSAALSNIVPEMAVLEIGGGISSAGRFALADTGDEVILRDGNGSSIDVVTYGASQYAGIGWIGAPVSKPPKGDALVRNAGDTNTSADWIVSPSGRTYLKFNEMIASVEPFSIPEDSKARVLRELDLASRSILLSVYELSDPTIVRDLAKCCERGVSVKVLLEGQPVGGMTEEMERAAYILRAAGSDVHLLRSNDSYKRYDYLHCKYLIIDDRRSLIMSENLGAGLIKNRGWGAVIDSEQFADQMTSLFLSDFGSCHKDVSDVGEGAFTVENDIKDQVSDLGQMVRYRCVVRAVASPDSSYGALSEMINSATDELLVEQLECQYDWSISSGLMRDLISASARGVKVRVLLDSSYGAGDGDKGNGDVVKELNTLAKKNALDLEAKLVSPYHPFQVMHNKGIIADDEVLISSINWVDNALFDNREVGVIVTSKDVREFYESIFWNDWSDDPDPPVVRLERTNITAEEGSAVLLDASNTTDMSGISSMTWYDDTLQTRIGQGKRCLVLLSPGFHLIRLEAVDMYNNSINRTIEVNVLANVVMHEDLTPYAVVGAGAGSLLIWKLVKKKIKGRRPN